MSVGCFTDKKTPPTDAQVLEAISRAHPYPEGRWVFVPIESEQDAEEFKQLLAMRMNKRQR